jgi:hypothetical protein
MPASLGGLALAFLRLPIENIPHYSIPFTSDTAHAHGQVHSGLPQYNRAVATMLQLAVSPRVESRIEAPPTALLADERGKGGHACFDGTV